MNNHEQHQISTHAPIRLSDLADLGIEQLGWLEKCLARGRGEEFSEFHALTPRIARILLARNPDNRTFNQTKLDQYIADVKAGNWAKNGESIIISSEGLLNDGQHRCLAVALSEKSIVVNFVFGVARDTRKTTDQGFGRTLGGRLQMDGVTDANRVAAIAGYVWQYENFGLISRQAGRRPTPAQLEEKVASCLDEINAAISVARRRGVEEVGKLSLVAFCYVVFARLNKEKAGEFISRLIDGQNLAADNPIYLGRQRLLSSKRCGSTEDRAEIIFKAWAAFSKNKKISEIRVRRKSGSSIEPLPRI